LSSVQEYLPGSVSQAFHLSADALIGSLLVLRTGEHGSNNTQAYASVLRGSLVVSIHLSVAADWRTWLQHQKKNKHRLMHHCCRIHKRGPLVVELQTSAGQAQQ